MTRRGWWMLALIIAALALGAAANSISNGFTYDDIYLLVKAARMHTLTGWWREFAHTYWPEEAGGDGYRPLTIISFRLQWAAAHGAPIVFHAVNIAIHTLTAVAVFWLASAILPIAAAWIVGALYAVHPVHVEAIANVVGQSELMVGLLATLIVGTYLHGRLAGPLSWKRWSVIGGIYAIAVLFKEHAIMIPALLILAEFTVVRDRALMRERLMRLRLPMLVLALIAVGYLWARSAVVISGVAGFQPFIVFQALKLSGGNRVLTMIGAAPEWLRLFLWPARLMTEYAPPYIDVAQGPSVTQLPGLLLLLGIIGLAAACWRRSPATTFGILWIIITLLPASNFIVPAGFIIAERTLLLPSVGAVIAIGSIVPWLYARVEESRVGQYLAAAAVAVLLALGIARSYTRDRDWYSNDTLFRAAIKDSPLSYRAHFMLGVHLFEQRRMREGEQHYREALRLFPYDPLMAYALAEQYRGAGMCAPAIPLYRWMFELEPNAGRGHLGLADCLLLTMHLDEAREEALKSIRAGGKLALAKAILASARAARDTMSARRARGDTIGTVTPSAVPISTSGKVPANVQKTP